MCEIHKIRKRPSTCDACREELGKEESTTPDTTDTISDLLTKKIIQDSNEILEPAVTEQQYRSYDHKAIRVMIEAEITKAVSKVRSEMSDMMRISWEHMHIPYGTFCLELLYCLEKEGWKYCDFIKGNTAKTLGYNEDGDFFIVQRVVKKENPPKPDFSKQGSLKRYMDKVNGKINI